MTNGIIEEIKTKRNHSWFREIETRAFTHLDKPALRYHGKEIKYSEYLHRVKGEWAPALKMCEIKKNDRVVVCVSSTFELAFLFGAISCIGAVINTVSSEFDQDYIYSIVMNSSSDYVFVSEDRITTLYKVLKRLDSETNKKIVIIPVDLEYCNNDYYSSLIKQFVCYDKDELDGYLSSIGNTVSLDEFLKKGEEYTGAVEETSNLEDIFTISYSSGTTDGNKPKGIVHSNKHYIVMGRYHDKDVSGLPELKNSVTYSIIPTHSNSYLASVLSDTLMEGACVALDPITNNEYFLFALLINRPTLAIASTSTWLTAATKYYKMDAEEASVFALRDLLLPTAVGEGMSLGEERYLNGFVKHTKCGTGITRIPISKMSVCGGCCEMGSLFTRLFRVYASHRIDRFLDEPIGFRTYDFVDIRVLRDDGTFCNEYEYGRLVGRSECTMIGYDNEPEQTKQFFVTDVYGKKWGYLGCNGYKDRKGNIYIKGRERCNSAIPEYKLVDVITKDLNNILSAVAVYYDQDCYYKVYVKQYPGSSLSEEELIKRIARRCRVAFGKTILDSIYILFMDNDFTLTKCLKRDIACLRENKDINNCIRLSEHL